MRNITFYLLAMFLFTNPAFAQWTLNRNGLPKTEMKSIISKDKILFVGTNSAGIFASNNNGESWKAVNNGLGNKSVNVLAINGNIIYAGTENGVFVSANNGESWTSKNTGLPDKTQVSAFAFLGSTIFIGVRSKGILFVSNNNGETWKQSNSGLPPQELISLTIDGSNIFAGTHSGIYISKDNGTSWVSYQKKFTAQINSMAIIDSAFFVATPTGMAVSTDGGIKWSDLSSGLHENEPVVSLAKSGKTLFAGTYYGVFSLEMFNGFWESICLGFPEKTTANSLAINGTNLFAATDIGLYYDYKGVSPANNIDSLIKQGKDFSTLKWQIPEEGDYLLLMNYNISQGNLIFKKSKNIHYGYNFETKQAENSYRSSKDRVDTLFMTADKLQLENFIEKIPRNMYITKNDSYSVIQYKKGDKIITVCWNLDADDERSKQLNIISGAMGGFW
jgi:photosystem II stability/assembly factor-like uncharacterized protein